MLWNCQERGDLLGLGVILVWKVMIDLLRLIVEVLQGFKIARYIQIHIRNHSAKYSVTFSTLVVVRRVSGAAVVVSWQPAGIDHTNHGIFWPAFRPSWIMNDHDILSYFI